MMPRPKIEQRKKVTAAPNAAEAMTGEFFNKGSRKPV
jgi:hypothetical protein